MTPGPLGDPNGCPASGKVRHTTAAEAERSASRIRRTRKTGNLKVYYCLLCDGYHLTSGK